MAKEERMKWGEKEDKEWQKKRDKLLIYLTEQTNNDVTDCRLKIAKENGRIEGLRMAAVHIARYVRGQAESEDKE